MGSQARDLETAHWGDMALEQGPLVLPEGEWEVSNRGIVVWLAQLWDSPFVLPSQTLLLISVVSVVSGSRVFLGFFKGKEAKFYFGLISPPSFHPLCRNSGLIYRLFVRLFGISPFPSPTFIILIFFRWSLLIALFSLMVESQCLFFLFILGCSFGGNKQNKLTSLWSVILIRRARSILFPILRNKSKFEFLLVLLLQDIFYEHCFIRVAAFENWKSIVIVTSD